MPDRRGRKLNTMINKLIPTATLFAVSAMSMAQTWDYRMIYDFKTRDTAVGVTTPITTLKDSLGIKGLTLQVDAFGGVSLNGGSPVAAILLLASAKAADRATVYFGPGLKVENSRPVSFVLAGGVSVKF